MRLTANGTTLLNVAMTVNGANMNSTEKLETVFAAIAERCSWRLTLVRH
jgi:hypothetical protein